MGYLLYNLYKKNQLREMKGENVMKRLSRSEICQKLNARLAAKEPILVCESGSGITAKLTAKYGIDMILVLSASSFRMRGLDDVFAGKPYGNGNDMTMQMVTDMRLVVGDDVPVIAGVCPNDPYRFVDDYVAKYKRMGVSGFTNFPTIGTAYLQSRGGMDKAGIGFRSEIEFLKNQQQEDMFTVGLAFYMEDGLRYAEEGLDMIVLDLRFLVTKALTPELYAVDKSCELVQKTYHQIKAIHPQCYVVVHGGPFDTIENVRRLFEKTDVDGFMGSKIFDVNVMTHYITENQCSFANLKLR